MNERHACVTGDELTRRFGDRLEWGSSTISTYSPGVAPPAGIRPTRDFAQMVWQSGAHIWFGFDYFGVSEISVEVDRVAGFDPGVDPELADFDLSVPENLFARRWADFRLWAATPTMLAQSTSSTLARGLS